MTSLVEDTTTPDGGSNSLYSKVYDLLNTAKNRQGRVEKAKAQSDEAKGNVSQAMLDLAKTVDIPAFLATVKAVERDWKKRHKAKKSPAVFQNPKSIIYKAWKLSSAFGIDIKDYETESSLRPVVRDSMKQLINSGINLRKLGSPDEVKDAWNEAKTRTQRIDMRVDQYSKIMNVLSTECLRIIRSGDDAHVQSISEYLIAATDDVTSVLPVPTEAPKAETPSDEVTNEIKELIAATA